MVEKVSDVVGIPDDVWLKAKLFNEELKNARHASETKLITFVMDQWNKMDASMRAKNAFIASFIECSRPYWSHQRMGKPHQATST